MIRDYVQKMRHFSRNMRLCLVFITFFGICVMGVYLVLFNLYLVRLGYGPEFIGLVVSIYGLVSALACLPVGLWAGRFGLRRTMIVGVCLGIVAYAAIPFTDALPAPVRHTWIAVWFALTGLSYAIWVTAIGPFMMRATTPEEQDHAISMYFALVPLGAFLGSLVAGGLPGAFAQLLGVSLEETAPYRYTLLLAAVVYLGGLVALLATSEEAEPATPAGETGTKGDVPIVVIALVVLAVFLQAAAPNAASTFFNVYMDTELLVSVARIGLVSALARLCAVPAPLFMPVIAARWGRRRAVVVAALGAALSVLVLSLVPHWISAGIGYAGSTAFMMVWLCAVFPYIMTITAERWQSTMSGAGSLATGLSSSAIALAGGFIAASLGFRSLFLMAASCTLAGVVIFWTYFRGPRGEPAASTRSLKAITDAEDEAAPR